jgi:hypothetical protein
LKRRNICAVIDRWGPLGGGNATSDAQLEKDSARVINGAEQNRGAADQPHESERSARRHDREASLHERLAAETSGCLYFAFLHAAEAHRAAARQERGASTSVVQHDLILRNDRREQT